MPRASKYKAIQLESAKWYSIGHGYEYEECCDCGLVHKVEFKLEKGRIFVKYTEHPGYTAIARRKRNKESDNATNSPG